MRQVSAERTGWRCQEISERHRAWGFNCPAVDVDFVMLEYNYGLPIALVEYKDRRAAAPKLSHPTYRALTNLADRYMDGPPPFFIATYCPDEWWFSIIPMNEPAKQWFPNGRKLSEQEYVRALYQMRLETLSAQDEAAIMTLNDLEGERRPEWKSEVFR